MARLQQVYGVYEEHARNVDAFSTVLWAEVDIGRIIDTTDETLSKLKKLKHLSDLPVYALVSKEIGGFLASLPLMKDLKSDALRKRHWDGLMVVRTATRQRLKQFGWIAWCNYPAMVERHLRSITLLIADLTLIFGDDQLPDCTARRSHNQSLAT